MPTNMLISDLCERYLELVKKAVTNQIYRDPNTAIFVGEPGFYGPIDDHCKHWPIIAHTMVGIQQLNNVEYCLQQVISDEVPGNFIEAGVWQGGVCIFARAVLKAFGITDRIVWVATHWGDSHRPRE